MRLKFYITGIILSLIISSPVYAAEKTVILSIKNMSCITCPYIVKSSLSDVSGVISVDVSFNDKIAQITFDDSTTNIQDLTDATADVGFPSMLKQ